MIPPDGTSKQTWLHLDRVILSAFDQRETTAYTSNICLCSIRSGAAESPVVDPRRVPGRFSNPIPFLPIILPGQL